MNALGIIMWFTFIYEGRGRIYISVDIMGIVRDLINGFVNFSFFWNFISGIGSTVRFMVNLLTEKVSVKMISI